MRRDVTLKDVADTTRVRHDGAVRVVVMWQRVGVHDLLLVRTLNRCVSRSNTKSSILRDLYKRAFSMVP